jgi:type I restriction enzyme R subunit
MTPEMKAHQDIDRQLDPCGWLVQDRREINISAGLGVAVPDANGSSVPVREPHARWSYSDNCGP